jgi:hypothetical protein
LPVSSHTRDMAFTFVFFCNRRLIRTKPGTPIQLVLIGKLRFYSQ